MLSLPRFLKPALSIIALSLIVIIMTNPCQADVRITGDTDQLPDTSALGGS